MTECTQTQFTFQAHFSRQVTGQFEGATMTSDAGGLLLREADRRLNLLPRLAQCFLDGRAPARVQHSVVEMISQRVSALALGYEDLNDHEQLRQDPVLKLLAGQEDLDQPLAGKSTLNRLELGAGTPDRYKKITFWKQGIDELLVDVFIEAHAAAPDQIVLDIDTTDVALHGIRKAASFTATTITTVTCRCTSFRANTYCAHASVVPTSTLRQEAWPRSNASSNRFEDTGPWCALHCAATPASAATS
jgi:hypothetical protein